MLSFDKLCIQKKNFLRLTGVKLPEFGVKYSEELFKLKDHLIKKENAELKTVKRCAREVALAVACNWNPGLTLGQQKDAIYKVADAVYNAHPLYHNSILGQAFPGLVTRYANNKIVDMKASVKTVGYSALTNNIQLSMDCLSFLLE